MGDAVCRIGSPASRTISELLNYPSVAELDWVPNFVGFDSEGREMLQYMEGDVPHANPSWLWKDDVLQKVAEKLSMWHKATQFVELESPTWNFSPKQPAEVICHNDFAPYNFVFQDDEIVGVIDYDLCAPGPRLWDIAYAAYRIVPFANHLIEASNLPFEEADLWRRLDLFLDAYRGEGNRFDYSKQEFLTVLIERVEAITNWTEQEAATRPDSSLALDAIAYRDDLAWLRTIRG